MIEHKGYKIEKRGDLCEINAAPGCVLEFETLEAAKSFIDDLCAYNEN